ncbi:MAG: class I SAM-dependent methyltransferase [Gammaproteobacteria bacterium]|nr:class I SAM-dependent methyltransferase [Gammaproteobacteria bacterium]
MNPEELLVNVKGLENISIGGLVLPADDFSISDFIANQVGGTWLHPDGINSTMNLLKHVSLSKDMNVLDLGCGLGSTSRYITKKYGCWVTAIDKDPDMIERAKKLTNGRVSHSIEYKTLDANSSELISNSFDCVIIQSVLCFNEKAKILKEAYRLLKSGGKLVINEVTWLRKPTNTVERVTRSTICETFKGALTKEQWQALLTDIGFENTQGTAYGFHVVTPYQMLREEGLFATLKIFWRVLRDPQTNMRLNAVSRYIKNYPGYFGYGIYSGTKAGV